MSCLSSCLRSLAPSSRLLQYPTRPRSAEASLWLRLLYYSGLLRSVQASAASSISTAPLAAAVLPAHSHGSIILCVACCLIIGCYLSCCLSCVFSRVLTPATLLPPHLTQDTWSKTPRTSSNKTPHPCKTPHPRNLTQNSSCTQDT